MLVISYTRKLSHNRHKARRKRLKCTTVEAVCDYHSQLRTDG
jgi:hypothetical protein